MTHAPSKSHVEDTNMPSYTNKTKRYKIAVNFTLETFNSIKKRASKEKKTFSEMADELCAVGIRCYDENDYEEAGLSSIAMMEGRIQNEI